MNSTIASNIIGGLSLNQQIASGSCSSVLSSHIEFEVTDNKKSYSVSNNREKYLWKLGGKGSTDAVVNGPNKIRNSFDQNKNSIVNPYVLVNGNKEKVLDDGIQIPKVQLYTGKIHMEWKQIYKIGAGLNNLGNTCFMNTVIQCLTYCPPLANYLLHDSDHLSKCAVTGFCMMCVMQRHMKRTIGKSGQVIKPLDVYQKLRSIAKHFQFGRQEDAHEFLRYVIDNLWKSCLANCNGSSKLDAASKETTVINKIFGGYHRSQVTCLRCKGKSNTYDHFMDFILDIKQSVLTLEKALEKFTHPELLQLENAYKCPKCKMKVSAQKRFSVYHAPNVATFQLKRFDYHRAFGGKITKQISYPEKLNLRPFMSDPRGDPVWYRLNAVLVHSGPSCNSGHYYCYVKNSNGYWYLMDDQRVHQVSINQVLSESAYVLFYIRTISSEGTSVKKCMENKSPLVKTGISATTNKRDNSTLKPSPLSENVQTGTTNSAKLQNYSLNIINKKSYMPLSQNRERVSFDIRPKINVVKEQSDSQKPTPKETTKSSISINQPEKIHAGLVPYCEGSSDSSDEDQTPVFTAKVSSIPHQESKADKNISLNPLKKHLVQQYVENVKEDTNISSPTPKLGLELKAKISPSVFQANRSLHCNSSISSSTTSHKVRATAVWNVTDINLLSPSVGSGSSSTSVNSTTDWNVITTDPERATKKVKEAHPVVDSDVNTSEKFNSETCLQNNNIQFRNDSAYLGKKRVPQSKLDSKDNVINTPDNAMDSALSSIEADVKLKRDKSPTVPTADTAPCLENRNQKGDFRKYKGKPENSFLENGESSKQEKLSFLKRTFSDANKISESPTQLHGVSENGHCSISKKAKIALDSSETVQPEDKHTSSSKGLLELNASISSKPNYKISSKSSDLKQPKDTVHQNGTAISVCERTSNNNEQLKKKAAIDDESSSSSSSGSSPEYVWVEKTKDTIEKDKSSKENSKDHRKNEMSSPNQSKKNIDKQNVVAELKNNSNFFYGAPVPSWTGEIHASKAASFESRKRYSDDYDDELDRGKVRKYKKNYRYQDDQFRKNNLFQRYQNKKNSGHSSFHDTPHSHYNDYGHRNFNSHHHWKQHRHDNYNNSYKRHYKSYSAR